LLAAGCSADTDPVVTTTGAVSIAPFNDCAQLRDYYVEGALTMVGPYGLSGSRFDGMTLEDGDAQSRERSASDPASGDDSSGALSSESDASLPANQGEGSDFSGTNNQEKGVDEADRVKTDGSIIVAVVEGQLQIVDAESADVVSTLVLDEIAPNAYDAELMLNGDTLLVLSSVDGGDRSRTTITRLNIGAPSAPEVLGSTRIEGSYRSARMIGDSVRLVLQTEPSGLRFETPSNGSIFAERDAEQANRAIIEESTIEDWVPRLEIIEAGESRGEVKPLTGCADVHRPGDFSGLSTVSVVTLDASTGGPDIQGVGPTSSTSLVASGETVYASSDRLIVATSPWGEWATPFETVRPDGQVSTALHSFDISDPESTDYVASGRVKGRLVNQFALSEREGVIRVATTSAPAWSSSEDSESALVVLAEDGHRLTMTGFVDGLGITEEIKSVRYLSPDLAAIVTFRQTDPLYLVDTSDPSAPAVTGELKIPGYSAYLHPISANYLLGIGQEADPETGFEEGLQASLFDINDLSDPQRVDQLTWPDGYSPVEWDHRAFTAWAQTGQFFLPAEIYGNDGWECDESDDEACTHTGPTDEFAGVVTATIEGDELIEGKRLPTNHSERSWSPAAERTIVIDNSLWTLHSEGMNRYDLESLDGGPVLSWKSVDSSSSWSGLRKSSFLSGPTAFLTN
ncbi:MAG: beta-propeller domain-containing protein, partial [Ornithinimicrobium sp.]